MTPISTAYTTTQLTYSVAQISADTKSALNTTSSTLAAGLSLNADQQDAYIQQAQQLLALARRLNAQAASSSDGVSLLGPDSASAASTATALQALGVVDLPPEQMFALTASTGLPTATWVWMPIDQVQALGPPTYDHNAGFNQLYQDEFRYYPIDSPIPSDSSYNVTEWLQYNSDRDPQYPNFIGIVIPGIRNRLVDHETLIKWADLAIGNATALTPQLESGNAKLQGQLDVFVDLIGNSSDLEAVSNRFLRDHADSKLRADTDYDTAVRQLEGRPRSPKIKPAP